MYAGYFNGVITAKCGCKIDLEAEWDAPRCRCGGGCWDDEGEWCHEAVIDEPCALHSNSAVERALARFEADGWKPYADSLRKLIREEEKRDGAQSHAAVRPTV
jgi:hypothetical protein